VCDALIIVLEIHNCPEDGNLNDRELDLSLESKTQQYKRPVSLNPSVSAFYISISDPINVGFECVELEKNAEVYHSAHKPLNAITPEQPKDKTDLIDLVRLLRSGFDRIEVIRVLNVTIVHLCWNRMDKS